MESKQWWWSNRYRYNKGLLISGFIAFILYCTFSCFIFGLPKELDETISEIALIAFGYLIMMGIANLLYTLGWIIDISLNMSNNQIFRERLFIAGYWFSFSLPILMIPSVLARFPI